MTDCTAMSKTKAGESSAVKTHSPEKAEMICIFLTSPDQWSRSCIWKRPSVNRDAFKSDPFLTHLLLLSLLLVGESFYNIKIFPRGGSNMAA